MRAFSRVSFCFLFVTWVVASNSIIGCGGRASNSSDDHTRLDDAGTDGSSGVDGGGPVDFPDAATGCLDLPGPVMVPIIRADKSVYCIDSTEVTNAQFNEWMRSGPDWEQLPDDCGHSEQDLQLRDESDLPVNYVSWCVAKSYCAWAGKQLCGAFDGTALDRDAAKDANRSAWLHACTAGGKHGFPYGDAYEEGRCVDWSWVADAVFEAEPVPVRSAAGCEGGFPGIFDMVGNVLEWVDAVDGERRGLAGGNYFAIPDDAVCTMLEWGHVESRSGGIRCCKTDL